jgi:hypothetical protein
MLLGYYIPNGEYNNALIDAFENLIGKRAAIIHFGQGWGNQYPDFPATLLSNLRARGSIPMLNWGSWAPPYNRDQPAYKLSNIIRGDFDGYLATWARAAKEWGHPFFLRFDHEMNGDWYPWSESVNGNSAGEYVTMWRHVHDIFTAAGASNVVWVWSPNVVEGYPITGLYPGSAYVDWLAMDGYNYGASESWSTWKSFAQLFGNTYNQLAQLGGQPMMIAETGCTEIGGSKPAWFTDMLTTQLRAGRWPRLKALVYFDWNAGAENRDWPIESSPAATDAWRAGIADAFYAANEFASITTIPTNP